MISGAACRRRGAGHALAAASAFSASSTIIWRACFLAYADAERIAATFIAPSAPAYSRQEICLHLSLFLFTRQKRRRLKPAISLIAHQLFDGRIGIVTRPGDGRLSSSVRRTCRDASQSDALARLCAGNITSRILAIRLTGLILCVGNIADDAFCHIDGTPQMAAARENSLNRMPSTRCRNYAEQHTPMLGRHGLAAL